MGLGSIASVAAPVAPLATPARHLQVRRLDGGPADDSCGSVVALVAAEAATFLPLFSGGSLCHTGSASANQLL